MESLADMGSELVVVARRAIEAFTHGVPGPGAAFGPPAAVFVTLRSPDGSLRGCIGSVRPATSSVAAETERSAVLAASRDPRFPPVTSDELVGLGVEVSVLLPSEPVRDPSELDPGSYGVIVRDELSGRQGVLLPGIDGVTEGAQQLAIARRKAGLAPEAVVGLERFRVLKFRDG